MKVNTYKKRRHQATAKLIAGAQASSPELDRSSQIAKAAAYLEATRVQFATDAVRAEKRLGRFEGGVLAGPLARGGKK